MGHLTDPLANLYYVRLSALIGNTRLLRGKHEADANIFPATEAFISRFEYKSPNEAPLRIETKVDILDGAFQLLRNC